MGPIVAQPMHMVEQRLRLTRILPRWRHLVQ